MQREAYANFQEPIASVVAEDFQGIDQKQDHDERQRQRVNVRRNAQSFAVQKAQNA